MWDIEPKTSAKELRGQDNLEPTEQIHHNTQGAFLAIPRSPLAAQLLPQTIERARADKPAPSPHHPRPLQQSAAT